MITEPARIIFALIEATILTAGIILMVTYRLTLEKWKSVIGYLLIFVIVTVLTVYPVDCIPILNTLPKSVMAYISLPIKTVVFLLITSITTSVFYNVNLTKCFFFSVYMIYIIFVSDAVIGNVSAQIFGTDIDALVNYKDSRWIIISICGKLLQLILTFAFVRLFPKATWALPNKYWLIMDIIAGTTYGLMAAFTSVNHFLQDFVPPILLSTCALTGYSVSVLTIYFFGKIAAYYMDAHSKFVYETSVNALEKEINQFKSSKKRMRAYHHDWKKNLNTVGVLLASDKTDDAIALISKLTNAMPILETRKYCGNPTIDAILTKKAERAANSGIDLRLQISDFQSHNIESIDVCNVLSNLLDNALEAVSPLDENLRWISFQCFIRSDVLHIITYNQYSGKIINQDGVLMTTKQNRYSHGIGLSIVEGTCKKYCGQLLLDYTDTEFIAHAQLMDTKPE